MNTTPLARHALAVLHRSAHAQIIAQVAEPSLVPTVRTWLDNGWPLVVGRQAMKDESGVDLGIALPPALGKRRLGFRIAREAIESLRAPCRLADVAPVAPCEWRAALNDLERRVTQEGLAFHVFGSFAWMGITGWPYVSPASDLDLTCCVRGHDDPDSCERILGDWEVRYARRADLEIVFPSGRAVSWREWRGVRGPGSPTAQVLAKSLRDVALVDPALLEAELTRGPCLLQDAA